MIHEKIGKMKRRGEDIEGAGRDMRQDRELQGRDRSVEKTED